MVDTTSLTRHREPAGGHTAPSPRPEATAGQIVRPPRLSPRVNDTMTSTRWLAGQRQNQPT
jgi:hypothetical protein